MSNMPVLRNSLGLGRVIHRRFTPHRHQFEYPALYALKNLDDIQAGSVTLSCARDAAAATALKATLCEKLQSLDVGGASDIYVLAQPTVFGRAFNPVVFFFCCKDQELVAVGDQVNNTPWDETYTYLLPTQSQETQGKHKDQTVFDLYVDKNFHVSPFAPMDLKYYWRIEITQDVLNISMHLSRGERRYLFAGLLLKMQPCSDAQLRRVMRRFPLQNFRTLSRIYWQALRLWLKRTPFFNHPGELGKSTGDLT